MIRSGDRRRGLPYDRDVVREIEVVQRRRRHDRHDEGRNEGVGLTGDAGVGRQPYLERVPGTPLETCGAATTVAQARPVGHRRNTRDRDDRGGGLQNGLRAVIGHGEGDRPPGQVVRRGGDLQIDVSGTGNPPQECRGGRCAKAVVDRDDDGGWWPADVGGGRRSGNEPVRGTDEQAVGQARGVEPQRAAALACRTHLQAHGVFRQRDLIGRRDDRGPAMIDDGPGERKRDARVVSVADDEMDREDTGLCQRS